jgi:hypothetical protein
MIGRWGRRVKLSRRDFAQALPAPAEVAEAHRPLSEKFYERCGESTTPLAMSQRERAFLP